MSKAWQATVHDALGREDGQFWDTLKASPEWAAYEDQIAQIMAQAQEDKPDPMPGQQNKEV